MDPLAMAAHEQVHIQAIANGTEVLDAAMVPDGMVKCRFCSRIFQVRLILKTAANLALHEQEHIDRENGKLHQCPYCSHNHNDRESVNQHMKNRHPEELKQGIIAKVEQKKTTVDPSKPFKCKKCFQDFVDSGN
jgi:uncharacterized Zn-finger protein